MQNPRRIRPELEIASLRTTGVCISLLRASSHVLLAAGAVFSTSCGGALPPIEDESPPTVMSGRQLALEAPNLLTYPGAIEDLKLVEVDHVEMSGDVAERGWYQDVGASPIGISGFGTYGAKGDLGAGDIEFLITLPPDATALIVPVVTGPAGTGTVFSAVDVTNNAVIGMLEEAPGLGSWRLWALPLPKSLRGQQIKVSMTDSGVNWGEWSAIGVPAIYSSSQAPGAGSSEQPPR